MIRANLSIYFQESVWTVEFWSIRLLCATEWTMLGEMPTELW